MHKKDWLREIVCGVLLGASPFLVLYLDGDLISFAIGVGVMAVNNVLDAVIK